MSETRPEADHDISTGQPVLDFRFGLPAAWGLMPRQLEIELEESFDGTRSNDKMLVQFSVADSDEIFRL